MNITIGKNHYSAGRLLMIIAIYGLATLLFFSWQKKLSNKPIKESILTPTTEITNSNSVLNCNDIKTFSSIKFGITFDCPKDMILLECDKDVNLNSIAELNKLNLNIRSGNWCKNRQGTIQVRVDRKPLYDKSVKTNTAFKIQEGKINIDGQSATRQRREYTGANTPPYSEFVSFSKNGIYFQIRVLSKELTPQFNQILSTFKFTANTSTWKTQKIPGSVFSFSYPPNYFLKTETLDEPPGTTPTAEISISDNNLFERSEFSLVISFWTSDSSEIRPTTNTQLIQALNTIGFDTLKSNFGPDLAKGEFLGDPPWSYYRFFVPAPDHPTKGLLISVRTHNSDEPEYGGSHTQRSLARQIISTLRYLPETPEQ